MRQAVLSLALVVFTGRFDGAHAGASEHHDDYSGRWGRWHDDLSDTNAHWPHQHGHSGRWNEAGENIRHSVYHDSSLRQTVEWKNPRPADWDGDYTHEIDILPWFPCRKNCCHYLSPYFDPTIAQDPTQWDTWNWVRVNDDGTTDDLYFTRYEKLGGKRQAECMAGGTFTVKIDRPVLSLRRVGGMTDHYQGPDAVPADYRPYDYSGDANPHVHHDEYEGPHDDADFRLLANFTGEVTFEVEPGACMVTNRQYRQGDGSDESSRRDCVELDNHERDNLGGCNVLSHDKAQCKANPKCLYNSERGVCWATTDWKPTRDVSDANDAYAETRSGEMELVDEHEHLSPERLAELEEKYENDVDDSYDVDSLVELINADPYDYYLGDFRHYLDFWLLSPTNFPRLYFLAKRLGRLDEVLARLPTPSDDAVEFGGNLFEMHFDEYDFDNHYYAKWDYVWQGRPRTVTPHRCGAHESKGACRGDEDCFWKVEVAGEHPSMCVEIRDAFGTHYKMHDEWQMLHCEWLNGDSRECRAHPLCEWDEGWYTCRNGDTNAEPGLAPFQLEGGEALPVDYHCGEPGHTCAGDPCAGLNKRPCAANDMCVFTSTRELLRGGQSHHTQCHALHYSKRNNDGGKRAAVAAAGMHANPREMLCGELFTEGECSEFDGCKWHSCDANGGQGNVYGVGHAYCGNAAAVGPSADTLSPFYNPCTGVSFSKAQGFHSADFDRQFHPTSHMQDWSVAARDAGERYRRDDAAISNGAAHGKPQLPRTDQA